MGEEIARRKILEGGEVSLTHLSVDLAGGANDASWKTIAEVGEFMKNRFYPRGRREPNRAQRDCAQRSRSRDRDEQRRSGGREQSSEAKASSTRRTHNAPPEPGSRAASEAKKLQRPRDWAGRDIEGRESSAAVEERARKRARDAVAAAAADEVAAEERATEREREPENNIEVEQAVLRQIFVEPGPHHIRDMADEELTAEQLEKRRRRRAHRAQRIKEEPQYRSQKRHRHDNNVRARAQEQLMLASDVHDSFFVRIAFSDSDSQLRAFDYTPDVPLAEFLAYLEDRFNLNID